MNEPHSSQQQLAEGQPIQKKRRDSNLELYRIIVMLLIVAHHYVVNSGLFGVINASTFSASSVAMAIFGAWGKTGINCFVLITGYFMCKSKFTWSKLLKLYLQVAFYAIIIYGIFCITGHETLSVRTGILKLFPVRELTQNFTGCFLTFYLFIPFLNILVQHLNKRNHAILCLLLITVFSVIPTIPSFPISLNYVEWFIVLYILASYIRFYSHEWNISHKQWGIASLFLILVSCVSIVGLLYLQTNRIYHFVSDSNKLFALSIAFTTFMWFKGLKIKYSPIINTIGATTFGVLLIHANSNAMRHWLWRETVDCVGHFGDSLLLTLGYASVVVLIVFFICSFIDWIRMKLVEAPLLNFTENFIKRIIMGERMSRIYKKYQIS